MLFQGFEAGGDHAGKGPETLSAGLEGQMLGNHLKQNGQGSEFQPERTTQVEAWPEARAA